MAKPGPKPRPTADKILRGNPGKRKLPDNEPQPEKTAKPPPAPRYLCKVGKKEWRWISKELHKMGLLTKIDLVSLGAYCVQYAIWVDACKNVIERGSIAKTKNGNIIQNPYLSVLNRAQVEMRKWLIEFGMTPSSRSRVTVEKPKEADPREEFLKRGGKLAAVK